MDTNFRELFKKHINPLVSNDIRNALHNDILGYYFNYVTDRILLYGRADFSTNYIDEDGGSSFKYHRLVLGDYGPTLTPEDKVLLYCYIYLKTHFEEVLFILKKHQTGIEQLFYSDCKTLIIDFGCGPGTVCFAIADLFKGKTFDYIGIDIAPAMQKKANELFITSQAEQLISKDCTAKFISSWDEFNEEAVSPKTKILLSFSLFFSSHSLTENDLKSLTLLIKNLKESNKITEIEFFCMNSKHEFKLQKYKKFIELMNLKSSPETMGDLLYEIIPLKKPLE